MRSDDSKFSDTLKVRCPARLPAMVEQAAQRECMTASEYVRRSIIEKLKADGLFATEVAA